MDIIEVSANKFRTAIGKTKGTSQNSWMVDVHIRRDYNGMRCFLTKDRLSGIAVTKDGDIVSVFSHAPAKTNRMGKLIPWASLYGGRKLDCYAAGLQNMYSRFGAKATGKTAFIEKYAPKDWDGVRKPHIVAMTVPSFNTILKSYDSKRTIDLSKVKEYSGEDGYDKMIRARDNKLRTRRAASILGMADRYNGK